MKAIAHLNPRIFLLKWKDPRIFKVIFSSFLYEIHVSFSTHRRRHFTYLLSIYLHHLTRLFSWTSVSHIVGTVKRTQTIFQINCSVVCFIVLIITHKVFTYFGNWLFGWVRELVPFNSWNQRQIRFLIVIYH